MLCKRLGIPHSNPADRRSAVFAFRHGSLAAWHTYVAVTGYVFNLAERSAYGHCFALSPDTARGFCGLSLPASPSSDRRGAAIRNASTSSSSLNTSSSFCLRTSFRTVLDLDERSLAGHRKRRSAIPQQCSPDPSGRQVESIAVQTGDKRMGLGAQEVRHRLLHRYG